MKGLWRKKGLRNRGEKEGEGVAAYVVGGPSGVGMKCFVIMVAKIFVPFHTYHDMNPSASHVTTKIVADCCGNPEYRNMLPIIMLIKAV